MALLLLERFVELLIAGAFAVGSLVLGRIFAAHLGLGDVAAATSWLLDHPELSALILLVLLFAYLTIVGLLVRYLIFFGRGDRRFCGLYAQIFFGPDNRPIVAPYLVLFDLLKNNLLVAGHAFVIDDDDDVLTHVARWESVISHIGGRGSAAAELQYVYTGYLTAQVDRIKGVSNLGLSEHNTSKPRGRAGYICDLKIPAGELGLIRDADSPVRAFRIATVRFDDMHFYQFLRTMPNPVGRLVMRLFRISKKVSEEAFERFLKESGLHFLAGAELKGHDSWVRVHDAVVASAERCRQACARAAQEAAADWSSTDALKPAANAPAGSSVDTNVARRPDDFELDTTG